MTKTYEGTYELMEKLAFNHHYIFYDKTTRKPTLDILQMDVINVISDQLAAVSKKIQSLEV